VKFATIHVFLWATGFCLAQPVKLSLSSADVDPSIAAQLDISLSAPSDSAPAGIQWTLQIPRDLEVTDIQGTKSITEAGKTLVCNKSKCIIYGLNRKSIPNGVIAVVSIKGNQSAAGQHEIQILDAIAASLEGITMQVLPTAGRITISKRQSRAKGAAPATP
jgi:hypothetical protein